MTQRTVEVERTVTDEETILFCDYCGESKEDEGRMVTYRKDEEPPIGFEEKYPDEPLHLHEECVKAGLGDLGPRPSPNEVCRYEILLALDWFTGFCGFVSFVCVFLLGERLISGLSPEVAILSFFLLVSLGVMFLIGGAEANKVREEWKNWL